MPRLYIQVMRGIASVTVNLVTRLSGQPHAPAALLPGKEPPLTIEYEKRVGPKACFT